MGASAYGAEAIIASQATYENIVERGQQDFDSEVGRFPRLFDQVETVPGLTWPTLTFEKKMSVWLGRREVQLLHLGRSHTKGDIVAWIPDCKVCFAGDMVEYGATPYTGDAYLKDWPTTLDNLMAPGRGKNDPRTGRGAEDTGRGRGRGRRHPQFPQRSVWNRRGLRRRRQDLNTTYKEVVSVLTPKYGHWVIFKHCLPFDVTRAYQEAGGQEHPQIWTAERDREMWERWSGTSRRPDRRANIRCWRRPTIQAPHPPRTTDRQRGARAGIRPSSSAVARSGCVPPWTSPSMASRPSC